MKERITFRIDQSTLSILRAMANKKGIKLSRLIRDILEEKTTVKE